MGDFDPCLSTLIAPGACSHSPSFYHTVIFDELSLTLTVSRGTYPLKLGGYLLLRYR